MINDNTEAGCILAHARGRHLRDELLQKTNYRVMFVCHVRHVPRLGRPRLVVPTWCVFALAPRATHQSERRSP